MLDELNFFVSFLAGVISFLSPCVFPLVPSFLFSLSGSVEQEGTHSRAESEIRKSVLLLRTLFFILGFTILFVTLGYIFSSIGILLGRVSVIINVVAGAIVILIGLHQLFGIFRILHFELRFLRRRHIGGNASALFAGFAFGAGWSPCIGPLLTAILVLAGQRANVAQGIVYLTLYGLGLGLPFVLIVLCIPLSRCRAFLTRHLQRIKRAGGVMLILVGLLIISGQWRILNSTLIRFGRRLEMMAIQSPILVRTVALLLYTISFGFFLYRFCIHIKRRKTANRMSSDVAEQTDTVKHRVLGVRAIVLISAMLFCVTLAVLEAGGHIATAMLVGRWLQFQGI